VGAPTHNGQALATLATKDLNGEIDRTVEEPPPPAVRQATALCEAALVACRDGDTSELHDLLDAQMAALVPESFHVLEMLAVQEAALYPQSEALTGALVNAVWTVSETVPDQEGGRPSLMFAAALRLEAGVPAPALAAMTGSQCKDLVEVLVEYDVIGSDAAVTFLPRLLSPADADALGSADVYAVSRALALGDTAAALTSLAECRERRGLPDELDGEFYEGHFSVGVLVGLLKTEDEVAFPLAQLIEHEEEALDKMFENSAKSRARDELADEVTEVLGALKEPLSTVWS
jgi:hypothetical protein